MAKLSFWEPPHVVRVKHGIVTCTDVRFARTDERNNGGAGWRTCAVKQACAYHRAESSEGE